MSEKHVSLLITEMIFYGPGPLLTYNEHVSKLFHRLCSMMVENSTNKPKVKGSNPVRRKKMIKKERFNIFLFLAQFQLDGS